MISLDWQEVLPGAVFPNFPDWEDEEEDDFKISVPCLVYSYRQKPGTFHIGHYIQWGESVPRSFKDGWRIVTGEIAYVSHYIQLNKLERPRSPTR